MAEPRYLPTYPDAVQREYERRAAIDQDMADAWLERQPPLYVKPSSAKTPGEVSKEERIMSELADMQSERFMPLQPLPEVEQKPERPMEIDQNMWNAYISGGPDALEAVIRQRFDRNIPTTAEEWRWYQTVMPNQGISTPWVGVLGPPRKPR